MGFFAARFPVKLWGIIQTSFQNLETITIWFFAKIYFSFLFSRFHVFTPLSVIAWVSPKCLWGSIKVAHTVNPFPPFSEEYSELNWEWKLRSKSLRWISGLDWLQCAYEEQCLASDVTEWKMSARDRNHGRNNRTLLRFTARFWNMGRADFRSNAEKNVWQWHRCHGHFHSMERFADYDITDMQGNKVAEGHKASFCLEDYECEKGTMQK